MRLVLRRDAAADVQQALEYYARFRHDERFLFQLEQTFQKIVSVPAHGVIMFRDVRRTLLKKYPYAVFYLIEPGCATVLAVRHQKRNPADWLR